MSSLTFLPANLMWLYNDTMTLMNTLHAQFTILAMKAYSK